MATTESWQLPSAFVSEQRYLLPSSRAGSSALVRQVRGLPSEFLRAA
jgi:hypothetical protein